jgi:hypothetical protein
MPGVDPASVTNLHGEFLITGNPGDQGYDLEVEARGCAKRLVDLLPTGEKAHEIRLTEGATVTGRILKDGRPATGIAVGLVQCDRGAGQFVGAYRIATDSQGRYTFANVHPNDEYSVYTAMADAARFGTLPVDHVTVGGDGTTTNAGDRGLAPVHRIAGRLLLTDGKAVPSGTRLLLSREDAWDSQSVQVAPDGSFAFAGVPEEAVTLYTRIAGYRLASKRNRFQQVRQGSVALFVDSDKPKLEIFFEPQGEKATK